MADITLKTDYKDDVLDTSINTQRKYQMIQNEDGTVSFVDVTEYAQTGDSFGAKDVNAIAEACNGLNSKLILDYAKKELITLSASPTEIVATERCRIYIELSVAYNSASTRAWFDVNGQNVVTMGIPVNSGLNQHQTAMVDLNVGDTLKCSVIGAVDNVFLKKIPYLA